MPLSVSRRSVLVAAGLLPIATRVGHAALPLQKLHFGFGTKAISPIIINILIPEALGYYREEGLTVEPIPLGSNAAVMGSLQIGRIEFGVATPAFEIPIVARGESLPIVDFYEYTYPFKWGLAVNPDSPVKKLTDLKGKRIGVSGLGETDYPVGQEVFRLAGIDPKKDLSWLAVGEGVTAGEALKRGDIDALFYFDTGFGAIEAAGIPLRYLPLPPNVPKVGGLYLATKRETLKNHRKWAVGLARGVAKASIFIRQNPEAASYLFIKMFPEAAPKGKDLQQQVKAIMVPVTKRLPLYRSYDKSVTKWGQISPAEWQEEVKFANAQSKIADPSIFYTNALIDEINRFDQNKIREQAKNFKLPWKT